VIFSAQLAAKIVMTALGHNSTLIKLSNTVAGLFTAKYAGEQTLLGFLIAAMSVVNRFDRDTCQ
jgi:hypothetical protein